MNTGKEARFLIKAISEFMNVYAPNHLTQSPNTLKSYRSTLQKYLAFLEDRCLLITGRVSIMLMIVCIPYSGIHSRVGQRLTGERMIRPAGEWKSVFHFFI